MSKLSKVASAVSEAFENAVKYRKGNDEVEVLPNVTILKLHGNPIAYRCNDPERSLYVRTAGWMTKTTKDRLNAIEGVNITQRAEKWYLNGELWDGK